MTPGQRGGLALVFVTAIGLALAMPVIDADRAEPTRVTGPDHAPTVEPSEEPAPTPTEEAEPSPTPTPTPVGPPDELAGEVPDGCLSARPLPLPGSVVTVNDDGEVTSVPTEGGAVDSFEFSRRGFPAAFSPSGSFVAFGDGAIATPEGERVGGIEDGPSRLWAWSPQADCLFGVTSGGVLVAATPKGRSEELTRGPITSFAVAPSGDRIVVFGDDAALVYDLRSGRLVGEPAPIPNPSEPLLWRGRNLYFGTPDGKSLDVGRIRVRKSSVSSRGVEAQDVRRGSPAECAGRALAVRGDGRLIELGSGNLLGDPAFVYRRPSCAPAGSFIAVPRRPRGSQGRFRLVALQADGSYFSDIGTGEGNELLPDWGPSGTGVIFLSVPPRGRLTDVVYARSGGGITLPVKVWRFRGFDWSATAPTGIPGTRS